MKKQSKAICLHDDEVIKNIYLVRGLKVMLDEDLAMLYEVATKRLNEQVQRNRSRFPKDFMFRLTSKEFRNLKSQFATSSWGGINNRTLMIRIKLVCTDTILLLL